MIAKAENVIYQSSSDEWNTPDAIFNKLDTEFHFTLDPCSTDDNYKCDNHFTREQDGLKQFWENQRVFCNPPYSKIKDWVKKAYIESKFRNALVVMLIPSRTDTRWFHEYIYHNAEIRFVKGRLKFSNSRYNAPFPSMICIFRPK